jgi:uncharacterized delta-60 repeat protein
MLVALLVVATIIGATTTQFIPLMTTTHHTETAPARSLAPMIPAQITWSKTYGGTGWDGAQSVQETSDGGYIVAGFTLSYGAGAGDFWLVKTNSSGNRQWNRTYGGTSDDEAYSVKQTSDGGYIVAGYTDSFGAGSYDFWLVKTDSSGNQQWNKTFGGTYEDEANSVQQTSDGGYIVAGYTDSLGAGAGDFWLVKTDSSGNQQWNRTYGGTSGDEAYSVQQTSDGGYILAGYTSSFGAGEEDFWLVKTDSVGNQQWNKTYGGTGDDEAYSVQQTSDGGYVLAGYTSSFGAGWYDFWLVKTNSSGSQQWNKTYGGTGDEMAYSVQQTSDGGYIMAGHTKPSQAGRWNFWLVKTDTSGNQQWNKSYGGSSDSEAYSVQQTSDGGYIVAGYIDLGGDHIIDFWLLKTDGSGNIGGGTGQDMSLIIVVGVAAVALVVASVADRLRKRRKKPSVIEPVGVS